MAGMLAIFLAADGKRVHEEEFPKKMLGPIIRVRQPGPFVRNRPIEIRHWLDEPLPPMLDFRFSHVNQDGEAVYRQIL